MKTIGVKVFLESLECSFCFSQYWGITLIFCKWDARHHIVMGILHNEEFSAYTNFQYPVELSRKWKIKT